MTRAWFENVFGDSFHKDFSDTNELESFIATASKAGTRLIGTAGIDYLEDT